VKKKWVDPPLLTQKLWRTLVMLFSFYNDQMMFTVRFSPFRTFTLRHMACITDDWFISHEEVIYIHFLLTPSKFYAQPFSKMTDYDNLGIKMTNIYQTMPVNADFR
jgi:hypothetical protein